MSLSSESTITRPIPDPEAISDHLKDLIAKPVSALEAPAPDGNSLRLSTYGLFENDEGEVQAIVVGEIGFVCSVGAAFIMLSPNLVEELVATQSVNEDIADSYSEILNVFASLLNDAGGDHLKFSGLFTPGQDRPKTVDAFVRASDDSRTYQVKVGGYDEGKLSIFVGTPPPADQEFESLDGPGASSLGADASDAQSGGDDVAPPEEQARASERERPLDNYDDILAFTALVGEEAEAFYELAYLGESSGVAVENYKVHAIDAGSAASKGARVVFSQVPTDRDWNAIRRLMLKMLGHGYINWDLILDDIESIGATAFGMILAIKATVDSRSGNLRVQVRGESYLDKMLSLTRLDELFEVARTRPRSDANFRIELIEESDTKSVVIHLVTGMEAGEWRNLHRKVDHLIGEGCLDWTIDLKRVESASSTDIGMIIALSAKAARCGGGLRVAVKAGSEVEQVLKLLKADQILTVKAS